MDDKSVVCIDEFGKVVASNDNIALVRDWQDCIFYAVFVKNDANDEVPALLDVQDHLAFLAGPDPAGVEKELADFQRAAGDGTVSIKPVALKELARNAAMLGAWIVWAGSNGGVVVDSTLRILGLAGITKNESGVERLYRAEVLELPANEAMGTEPVAAQRWTISSIVDGQESDESETRLVYNDDGVILLNPEGGLLNGPRARSTLAPGERALFDWWRQPVYPFSFPDEYDHRSTEPLHAEPVAAGVSQQHDQTVRANQTSAVAPDGSVKDEKRFGRFIISAFVIALAGIVVMAYVQ